MATTYRGMVFGPKGGLATGARQRFAFRGRMTYTTVRSRPSGVAFASAKAGNPLDALCVNQACLHTRSTLNKRHKSRVGSSWRLFSSFKSEFAGETDTTDFRIFFKNESSDVVSPWHDIPLKAGADTFNFICEIPKETSAKMEVATDEKSTPIKQDIKKGNLRFYPYNINWNYGLFPQTWEDPGHVDKVSRLPPTKASERERERPARDASISRREIARHGTRTDSPPPFSLSIRARSRFRRR